MAATTRYSLDYPLNTDLVTNGAAQMQLLAGDVDTALANQAAALSTGYRNRVRNPYFSQAQRAVIGTNITDSWDYYVDSAVGVTWTRNNLAVTAGVPEFVTGSLTNTVASNAAGIARYVAARQLIPNVRAISNQTVVVSFYAKASVGTPKVGVSIDQYFGTGGTPSATVNGTGQAVTLTTSWARYSVTIAIPSVSGKTLGTAADDGSYLNLWYSAGSNYNTQSGSIGLQTATIDVTGVQLEASYLTDLERRDAPADLFYASNFSAWQTFTPTISQTNPVTTTVNYARYLVLGKTCWVFIDVSAAAAGTAGGAIIVNGTGLPAAKSTNYVGSAMVRLSGSFSNALANINNATTPSWNFYIQGSTTNITTTLAINDFVRMNAFYEIA